MRIYTPTVRTVRSEMTLVEYRIYVSRVIELWRDDADCRPVEWRTHYVILNGGTPVAYRSEDAAVESINEIIELIDEELELADAA